METILLGIFLMLTLCCNRGESKECYICITPVPPNMDTISAKMIDCDNGPVQPVDGKCIKAKVEVDGKEYEVRNSLHTKCKSDIQSVVFVLFGKSITEDKVSSCEECDSDKCNSAISSKSLQTSLFGVTILIFSFI